MAKHLDCPPENTLQELIDGKIEEPALSELSEHLVSCSGCQDKARTLSPFDTFVEPLRSDPAQQKIVESMPKPLIEKVKGIARAEATIGTVTGALSESNAASTDAVELDFLAPPQEADEIGRLGAYRILSVLGQGGMGMVFLAHDPHLDRRVALKVMLPRFAANEAAKQRFLREARVAAKLKSDHIVHIYQVAEERGVPYLAMELLEGRPLDQVLHAGEQLPLDEVLRIGREIAKGLAAAHAKGLIHRDIKPGNLWLDSTSGDRVKILDFGLARSEKDDIHITQSGAIVGTPAYMAPEQARGEKTVDARADLFSLGCVLYRLCAGDIPFKGETTMGVLLAIAMNEPTAPTKVDARIPQPLSDLIMQLLDKDPAKRPASAREVVDRLSTIEASVSKDTMQIDANRTGVLPEAGPGLMTALEQAKVLPAPRQQPRRRWPVVLATTAALLAGVVVLAGLVIYWQMSDGRVVRIETNDPAIKVAFDDGELKVVGAYQEPILLTPGKVGVKISKGDDFTFETDKLLISKGDRVVLKIEVVEGKVQIVRDGKTVVDAKELPAATTRAKPLAAPAPSPDYTLRFDGEQVVEIPNLKIDRAAHTVEVWAVIDPSGNQGAAKLIGNRRFGLGCTIQKGLLHAFVVSASEKAGAGTGASASDIPKERVHLAGVYDGKRLNLYLNGKRANDGRTMQSAGLEPPFYLGKDFTGTIDNVRISKIARYDKDFAPPQRFERDADALVLYRFDEGAGHVLNDSSGNGHHGKIVGARWVKPDGTPLAPGFPPLDPAWVKKVQSLPAEEQVKEVANELVRRNPGFDGKVTHEIKDGAVVLLRFVTDEIRDIAPVRALVKLEGLVCPGTETKGKLSDLSPLKGMTLTELTCPHNPVSDLSPLLGMKLKTLYVSWTAVSDLTPLRDMPLTSLSIMHTKVADLAPLKGMALTTLSCWGAPVADLTPLAGMPLTSLAVGHTKITTLAPLKGMKLNGLHFYGTAVADLTPLAGMPLTELVFNATPVSDLTPLKGMKLTQLSCPATVTDLSLLKDMPLKTLHCDYKPERDAAILRSIKTLETINEGPAREVLDGSPQSFAPLDPAWVKKVQSLPPQEQVKEVAAELKRRNPGFDGKATISLHGDIKRLELDLTAITDLSPVRLVSGVQELLYANHNWMTPSTLADLTPLRGMALTGLYLPFTRVSDLSPLKGMPLTILNVAGTRVADLKPLQGMKLTELHLSEARVGDLSPLHNMRLEMLACINCPIKDLTPLKGMPLRSLTLNHTLVTNLEPLIGMPLRQLSLEHTSVADLAPLRTVPMAEGELSIYKTKVADLTPLRHLKLTNLDCREIPASDLTPLREMSLKVLHCDFKPWRDADLLRANKILETINGKPVAEFWKEVDAERARFDAWAARVAKLPPKEQVKEVADELKRRNPGFDGKLEINVHAGEVMAALTATHVKDLTPLRAIPKLQRINCSGPVKGERGKLEDLSPLIGLDLTYVSVFRTNVSDLSPLKGMPLKLVNCTGSRVTDLSPLAGQQLSHLYCAHTGIRDLSVLKGQPLLYLHFEGAPVTDFAPLRGMPLVEVSGTEAFLRDVALLQSLKSVRTINGKPAADVLK